MLFYIKMDTEFIEQSHLSPQHSVESDELTC